MTRKFVQRYQRVTHIIEGPYHRDKMITSLPDGFEIILPILAVGGRLEKANGSSTNYNVVDDLSNLRGLLQLFEDGNAEITMESPESDDFFKPSQKYLRFSGKLVEKNSQRSATLQEASEDPRRFAVSFSKHKERHIGEGLNKNGEHVSLKYKGGLWLPYDKLVAGICLIGASFSAEKPNRKSFP